MYIPRDVVTTEAEIRAVVTGEFASQSDKIIDHIDILCRAWIERSPYVVMATHDSAGRVDVAPKGDPAGFVRILDDRTLAIPDRPGNHRYDSYRNILETGRIGLVFLVPRRTEVMRVNGSAVVVRDADLRATMAIKGRVPDFAVVVTVEEAFFNCGKAAIRSGLWTPSAWADASDLATYGEALIAHAKLDTPLDEFEARVRNNEENRLYDE